MMTMIVIMMMKILPGRHDFDENGSSNETDCDDSNVCDDTDDGDYDDEDDDDGSLRPD